MTVTVLLGFLRRLTLSQIEDRLGRENVVRKAQQYLQDGRIAQLWVEGSSLRAHVAGSSNTPYHVVIRIEDGDVSAQCSCPYTKGICWHAGAVLLTVVADQSVLAQLERQARQASSASPGLANDSSEQAGTPATATAHGAVESLDLAALRGRLLALPKATLVSALVELIRHDPAIEPHLLQSDAVLTSIDVRLFRQAVHHALRSQQILSRYEVPRVAADLQQIAESIRRLTASGHPEPALDLLLELAWLAWRRAEDVDDRDGALVATVRQVLSEWIKGWGEVSTRDRQKLARELFGWLVEDSGEVTRGLVLQSRATLGPLGLETLHALLHPALEQRTASRPGFIEHDTAFRDPMLERLRRAMRETAEARGQLDEYLSYCDPEGTNGAELLAAAERLAREGQVSEALRWVERGRRRARGTARHALEDLRVSLLLRSDRSREAQEAAWEIYVAEPGHASLRRLMSTVNAQDRQQTKRRALDHAESSVDATAFVDVCLEAEDAERLAHRLDLAPQFVLGADPQLLDRAVGRLEERVPWAAGRIALHLASSMLAEGDPGRFGRVRELLQIAQHSYRRAGKPELWEEAHRRLKQAHAVVAAWVIRD
jgi:hypothetical protein